MSRDQQQANESRALPAVWKSFFIAMLLAVPVAAEVVDSVDLQIQPPAGFIRAQAFLGFQQIETFSSIELSELEIPFPSLAQQLTPEAYASKNTQLVNTQALESGGRNALLLELETELAGTELNKWVLIIGDKLRSISITASYPRWAVSSMREPLKQALLSARWLRTWEEQLLYDLPFSVTQSENLKFVRRTPNMLILADITATGSLTPATPAIVIGHLQSETASSDIKLLSHSQIDKLETIEVLEILAEGETRIDGIPAYQIEARVRQNSTQSTHLFKQVLAVQPSRHLVIHASVNQTMAAQYLPQFDQIITSIAFK